MYESVNLFDTAVITKNGEESNVHVKTRTTYDVYEGDKTGS